MTERELRVSDGEYRLSNQRVPLGKSDKNHRYQVTTVAVKPGVPIKPRKG